MTSGTPWSAICDTFIVANEAVDGKHGVHVASVVAHGGRKEEILRCECGWGLPWSEYLKTIQHKQLSGAEPVLTLFRGFVTRFPVAQAAREKMLLIDQFFHGFHWYYKTASQRDRSRSTSSRGACGR